METHLKTSAFWQVSHFGADVSLAQFRWKYFNDYEPMWDDSHCRIRVDRQQRECKKREETIQDEIRIAQIWPKSEIAESKPRLWPASGNLMIVVKTGLSACLLQLSSILTALQTSYATPGCPSPRIRWTLGRSGR